MHNIALLSLEIGKILLKTGRSLGEVLPVAKTLHRNL